MGFLDNFIQPSDSGSLTPASQGLLAAGLGILANNRGLTSGTQALGLGGMQGLQQYGAARQSQMQQQLQNAQLQQLQYGLKNNQLFSDIARAYMTGGDPSQPQGQPQAAPQAPPAMPGADAGSMPMGGDPSAMTGSGAPYGFGGGSPAPASMGAGGPPQGGGAPPMQPPPQMPQGQGAMPPQGGASPMSALFGNIPKPLVAMGLLRDPGKTIETAMSQYSMTDLQKTMRAAGIDQNSALGQQILQQAVAKMNNIPLVAGRAGAPMYDQSGRVVAMAPKIPDNAIPQVSNGQIVGVSALPGAAGVEQINSAAGARGKAGYQLTPAWDPTANGGKGGMVQQTVSNVADAANGGAPAGPANAPLPMRNNNPGAVSPGGVVAKYPDMQTGLAKMDANLASYANDPKANTIGGAITKWVGSPANAPAYIADVTSRLSLPANTPFDANNPAQRQALATQIMLHENGSSAVFAQRGAPTAQPQSGPMASAPPLGAEANAKASAESQQAELSKSWSAQNDANTQAQTTASYLQQIKALAPKAATGPMSDRLNYVNGLLSLAGSQKATDAVTANNLLDKYSNQIVARLGSGGMGTDAARSILASAYPGAHMNVDAINEASDNLVGAANMTQARQRILQPLANKRDPVAYNDAATKFDQTADPRIFQYENIADPTARRAFAQNLVKQDPTILNKIKSLHDMGAFPQ